MKKLHEIFDIWYGVNLELINCQEIKNGIPFVSRQATNNGVSGYVEFMGDTNPAHSLSIAGSGSVLATFYHDYEYYSGRDIYIAKPKQHLTKEQMLFYAYVIEQNKYRYNYGRQANKTLRNILVPSIDELPEYINKISVDDYQFKVPILNKKLPLEINNKNLVKLSDVFYIKNSNSLELINCEEADNGIRFISRTSGNNGIVARIKQLDDLEPMPAKALTVALGGSVLSTFYQDEPFYTAFHIACLYPKKELSEEQMLFYAYVIEQNKYRYNYGRQANKTLKDILIPQICNP